MRGFFTRNLGLKIFSILLAVTIWWLIREEREREAKYPYLREIPTSKHEVSIPK